ncbi:hypothetical protein HUG17_8631 [Dermatophagoides farinae]|nr:hypothetical protein HUG17_8631 [Dermatophagoides farinae]
METSTADDKQSKPRKSNQRRRMKLIRRRANRKQAKHLTNLMITESNEQVGKFYEKIRNEYDHRKQQYELNELNRKQVEPLLNEIGRKRSELVSTLEKIVAIQNYRKSLNNNNNVADDDNDRFYRIIGEQIQIIREQIRTTNREETIIRNQILATNNDDDESVKFLSDEKLICTKNQHKNLFKSINFNRLLRLYDRRRLS